MSEEENKQNYKLEKIKILSILPNSRELQGDIYFAKLYSSDMEGIDWLYSGVEGYLGLIVDHEAKTKYISMFDQTSYQLTFQYELYKGFEKFFDELAPDFRSFEIETGFIGLKFEKEKDAVNFGNTLKKINPMNNIFKKIVIKEDQKDLKLKKKKVDNYLQILKETFCDYETKYDDKYTEDGIEISNHKNFSILNNISYDKTKKSFKFGKISDDLKDMFLSHGIKRKDLEKDLDFAFSLFKKVILGFESKKKKTINSCINKIEHSFNPPSEEENIRRQEEEEEVKLNKNSNKIINERKPMKQNVPKHNPKPVKKEKIGAIPPPPPSIPVAVPVVKTEQVKKPQVKKPLNKPENNQDDKNKSKEQYNGRITSAQAPILDRILSEAIRRRREQLTQFENDDDDKDDDDDDWYKD